MGTLIQVQHYQQNPLCLCSFCCVFLLGLSTFYRPLVAFNPNERKPCLCFHRRPCCLLHIAVGTIPPVVFRKTMADSTRRRCPKGPKCQVKTDNSNIIETIVSLAEGFVSIFTKGFWRLQRTWFCRNVAIRLRQQGYDKTQKGCISRYCKGFRV